MRGRVECHDGTVFDVGDEDATLPVDRNAITQWLLPNVFHALIESFRCRCRVQNDGHRHATEPGIGHRSDVEPLLIVTDLNAIDPDREIKKPASPSRPTRMAAANQAVAARSDHDQASGRNCGFL